MTGRLRHHDQAWLALVVLTVAVLHLLAFGNARIADDAWFAKALETRTLLDFLAFRYLHWSGRLPMELALPMLIGHPWLWKLLDGLMWLLLCFAGGRLALARSGVSAAASTALVFALLLLLSPAVVFNAGWWMTGSVNYLWPMALGLYGLLALAGPAPRGHCARAACALASGLAMYNEQVALVLLPASLLMLGGRVIARCWRGWDLAHVGFMALNALVLFAAPGSHRRFLSEEAMRFPNFDALGVLDKGAIGLGLVSRGMLDPANVLLLVLIACSAALVWRSPVGRWAKAALLAMLAWLLLGYVTAIPGLFDGALHAKVYAPPVPGGAIAAFPRAYALCAGVAFAIAALVCAASVALWRSRADCLAAFVAMLLGLASLAALGFSPTAYASGWRVHFVCQVAFLLVTARVVHEVRQQFGPRVFHPLLAAIVATAGYRVAMLLLHAPR